MYDKPSLNSTTGFEIFTCSSLLLHNVPHVCAGVGFFPLVCVCVCACVSICVAFVCACVCVCARIGSYKSMRPSQPLLYKYKKPSVMFSLLTPSLTVYMIALLLVFSSLYHRVRSLHLSLVLAAPRPSYLPLLNKAWCDVVFNLAQIQLSYACVRWITCGYRAIVWYRYYFCLVTLGPRLSRCNV